MHVLSPGYTTQTNLLVMPAAVPGPAPIPPLCPSAKGGRTRLCWRAAIFPHAPAAAERCHLPPPLQLTSRGWFFFFFLIFFKLTLKKKREQKLFWLQLLAHLWLLSNAKASRIQEFICWCQRESSDPNKGARAQAAVLARDQREAREPMLLSHQRSSCCRPFLGTRLLLRFLGAD